MEFKHIVLLSVLVWAISAQNGINTFNQTFNQTINKTSDQTSNQTINQTIIQTFNQTLPRSKITPRCCEFNTITVYGAATLQANPDQAFLQASITQNGATVNQAVASLSTAVNNIISILANSSLTPDDYFSTGFSVYPNTTIINGTSIVIGQIAYQSFQITIPSINPNGSNIGDLIDNLSTVNGIVLGGLSFDVKNKTQLYQLARQEAFINAQYKASDYTDALNVTLQDLLHLVDSFSSAPVVTPPTPNNFMMSNVVTPTTVNVGTISIAYNVQAVFTFK